MRPLDDGPLRTPNRRTKGLDAVASSPRCHRESDSPRSPDRGRTRALARGTGGFARRACNRAPSCGPHPGSGTHSDRSTRLPGGTSRGRDGDPSHPGRRRRSGGRSSGVGNAAGRFRNAVRGSRRRPARPPDGTSISRQHGSPLTTGRTSDDPRGKRDGARLGVGTSGGPYRGIAIARKSLARACGTTEPSRQVFGIPGHVRALVERIEPRHVLPLQLEIEDTTVLSNPIRADRFRNDDEPVLQAPADENLSRRPSVLRDDLSDDRMVESVSTREGAVRLQLNAFALAELEQRPLVQEGMKLDLVHGGWDGRRGEQFLQVANRVVADPDRAGESLVADLLQRLPGFLPQARHGPVDQVQVDVVEAELAATLLERPQRRLVAVVVVPELRRDEDLFPRDPALPDRGPEIPFVPVELRGIEMAVPDFEGVCDRLARLLSGSGLPHAEAEDRHLVPVVQGDAIFHGQAHRRTDDARATSTLTADDLTISGCLSSGRRTASSPRSRRGSRPSSILVASSQSWRGRSPRARTRCFSRAAANTSAR